MEEKYYYKFDNYKKYNYLEEEMGFFFAQKKRYSNLRFVVEISWESLLNKETEGEVDALIQKLVDAGIDIKDITFTVVKSNHKFNSKEWQLIRAWDKACEQKGVLFGFEDMGKTWSVKQVEVANSKINETADFIRASKCSPYEMVLMAYLTVTSRKYIEEAETDHYSKSRSIYSTMTNEEMVCQGFAEYLKAILQRVGNGNIKIYSNSVACSSNNETIDAYHSNIIIYIKDEKYGIDGYYYLDPTWDCQDENELPNLVFHLVPIPDIKNIKLHIRSEDVLGFATETEQAEELISDVIFGGTYEEEVQFTSDASIFSQEFIDDFLENNPDIIDMLVREHEQRVFNLEYEEMERLEIIVNAEQEVYEMFGGVGVDKITQQDTDELSNAIKQFHENLDAESLMATANKIIERAFERDIGTRVEPKGTKYCSPQKILKMVLDYRMERLEKLRNSKSKTTNRKVLIDNLLDNDFLLEIISNYISENSDPVHIGKTMEALRVVLTKLYPDISPKLIAQRVKDIIEHNTKIVSKHFNRKSQNPFMELKLMGEKSIDCKC